MGRDAMINELNYHIETLARLSMFHGQHETEGIRKLRDRVEKMVREHKVNPQKELEPHINLLYRRYFD